MAEDKKKKEAPKAEAEAVAGGAEGKKGATGQCAVCGSELYDGKCINAECEVGQRQWSKDAARDTAKATVPVPAAVTRSGRVD